MLDGLIKRPAFFLPLTYLITFAGEEYEENANLEITPKPDSILRVMMVCELLASKRSELPEEEP